MSEKMNSNRVVLKGIANWPNLAQPSNTRDGSLCQMYFLTIPKLEPVSRLTCRMEPPACRSAANASAF